MQGTIDQAWSWCTTSDFNGLRSTWRAAYTVDGDGRWCTPQGWEEEECKAGCNANGWYGIMSPRWLDDWVGVSGGGAKEYYRGVKMVRAVSAGAVLMCREVWRAAGKVWAERARTEEERARRAERLLRVERAREAASAKSMRKRRREASRQKVWVTRVGMEAALKGLEREVARIRAAGRPRDTAEMRVYHQHSVWGWKRIMKWWTVVTRERSKATRVAARRAAEENTGGCKRQRTLVEMWGGGARACVQPRARPPRKPPDDQAADRGGSRKRARDGVGAAPGTRRRKRKRFRRVARSVSDSELSSQEGAGVG